ncbi:MAG TPA: MFS transporter [Solirubrobacteraceae bacterium]|nr:MFS transporter [Solirubrobacteraceae bacterium]
MTPSPVRLGLRENRGQFSLLVAINAFVGAMVGLERSALPLAGHDEFRLSSSLAVLSFIIAFGVSKALVDLVAGTLAERKGGRRRLLILGWALALPVPLLIWAATGWWLVVIANLFLGANQGLAWSMTVNMKIDLVGPRRRGLALGLNEAAGYGGVAIATALAGALIATISPRAVVETGGAAIALIGFAASTLFVRDTSQHVTLEQATHAATEPAQAETATAPSLSEAFAQTSFRAPGLRACSQAGLVNNLNDGLAWGLTPLFLAAHGASGGQVAVVTAIYPAVWAIGQIPAGAASDRIGRRALIVSGMLLQAAALGILAASQAAFGLVLLSAVLLGLGTASVYPTLIAAISDQTTPRARATIVGVYRFWRDLGYALGGAIAGATADALGYPAAIAIVAALTALSGLWAAAELPRRTTGQPPAGTEPPPRVRERHIHPAH